MNWALSLLIAGGALASLVLNYPAWRRVKEPAYRIKREPVTAFWLAAIWALWAMALHSARTLPVFVVVVVACHIIIYLAYGLGTGMA